MKTTALTFRSRRGRRHTADDRGDDETGAPRLQTEAPKGETHATRVRWDFSGDRLLPWPLPVSALAVASCRRGDKNPGYAPVANRLFPRVLVGGAFLSGEDDVRLQFPVEQLLLKTLNAFDWWLLGD